TSSQSEDSRDILTLQSEVLNKTVLNNYSVTNIHNKAISYLDGLLQRVRNRTIKQDALLTSVVPP
ncbi:Hypothetical protein FKW44_006446, partial [Caligus rogercresseyi]